MDNIEEDLQAVAGEYEGLRNPQRYATDLPLINTLSEALTFCQDYWRRNNPNSLATYSRHLREFSIWAHSHLQHPVCLGHIDTHVMARYRFWLENRPAQNRGRLSPASIQVKLSSIAAMYKVLVRYEYVSSTTNPMQIETTGIRRHRLRKEPFEELRLSLEQLQELLSLPFEQEAGYWGLRDRILLQMLGYFGLRPVEMTWIKPSNLTDHTLWFERAKKNYPGSFWMPDDYVLGIQDMEYQYGIQPHQPLFIGQYYTGLSVRSIETIVHKYGAKIGVPELTPRDFRATVETFMDQYYEEIERDKYMGYVPPGTARKYYVKIPKNRVQGMFEDWVAVLTG